MKHEKVEEGSAALGLVLTQCITFQKAEELRTESISLNTRPGYVVGECEAYYQRSQPRQLVPG